MRISALVKLLRERRYWLGPLAFAVLLVAFLVDHLWLDSFIIGVFLAASLGFLLAMNRYEHNIFDRIKKGEIPEDEN